MFLYCINGVMYNLVYKDVIYLYSLVYKEVIHLYRALLNVMKYYMFLYIRKLRMFSYITNPLSLN